MSPLHTEHSARALGANLRLGAELDRVLLEVALLEGARAEHLVEAREAAFHVELLERQGVQVAAAPLLLRVHVRVRELVPLPRRRIGGADPLRLDVLTSGLLLVGLRQLALNRTLRLGAILNIIVTKAKVIIFRRRRRCLLLLLARLALLLKTR